MSNQPEKTYLASTSLSEALIQQFGTKVHLGYNATRIASVAVWNGDTVLKPIALIECSKEEDVLLAIRLGHEHNVAISVLAGGHDPSLRCVKHGALVLDIRPLNTVEFDKGTRVVTVGGGALARDVLKALPEDQVIVTGTFSTVGMAGLAMGGGYGRLNSYFGLALDCLKEATVVLADGTIVTASESSEPDLFWSLRGGGGNFGVITSMKFESHTVGSLLTALIFFPLVKAKAALLRLQELVDSGSDNTSYFSGFMTSPAGEPVFFLSPLWIGDRNEGEKLVAGLAAWDGAQVAQQGWSHYRDLFSEDFEAIWPKGAHYRLDVHNVNKITPEIADILVDGASTFTSPTSSFVIHDFHGAAAQVPPNDTAFVLRDNHFVIQLIAAWSEDIGQPEKHKEWADTLSKRLSRHSRPGAYVNLLHPDEVSRAQDFYGAASDKLRRLKSRYDPRNVFSAPGSLIGQSEDIEKKK